MYAEEGVVDGLAGLRWRFETGGAVRSSPAVVGDALYVGSADGRLYALGVADGNELWSFDAGSAVISSPAVAADLVYFGDRGNVLHALDRMDGSLAWQFPTGPDMALPWGNEGWDYFTSSPAVVDGIVLFGSGDGSLYAVDATSGAQLWRYATEGRIRSSPAVSDGVVYVGSMDGSLHAVDVMSGEGLWRYDTEGRSLNSAEFGFDRRSIQSSPSVGDGAVFFGSRDGYVYAVETATGELRWRFDQEVSWCISSPGCMDGMVFAGSSDGLFVQALDATTGEELWRTTIGTRVFGSPSVAGETVVTGDHDGNIRAMDRLTGEERWSYRTGRAIQSSAVVSGGAVFVGSDDGSVYALDGTEGPSPHRTVFWDEDLRSFYPGHEALRDHLSKAGYAVLDATDLGGFMVDRIEDQEPSVVVFAKDHVPVNVGATAADTVLFRRYLDAGGRIVWLGYPPFFVEFDAETGQAVGADMARTTAVLGVDHSSVTVDEYSTRATESGRDWGLRDWWIDQGGVDPSQVSEVLATSERGGATAWFRSYSASPSGGFVKLWGMQSAIPDPAIVRSVAEYRLR